MHPAHDFPVKKTFLYFLIVSVLLSAVLGILAILSGTWGEFQVRILVTSVIISGASICGLACGTYLATKRGRLLPLAGIALALVAAAMIIAGVWIHVLQTDAYLKFAVSISVFAVACGHLALLSMARLAEWFVWSIVAAHVVIFGVASLIVLLIVTDPHGTGMFQLLGVAAIIDAAITILIPVFHWLSRSELAPDKQDLQHTSLDSAEREIAQLKARIAQLEKKLQQGAWESHATIHWPIIGERRRCLWQFRNMFLVSVAGGCGPSQPSRLSPSARSVRSPTKPSSSRASSERQWNSGG
jgi:hypothetical protein